MPEKIAQTLDSVMVIVGFQKEAMSWEHVLKNIRDVTDVKNVGVGVFQQQAVGNAMLQFIQMMAAIHVNIFMTTDLILKNVRLDAELTNSMQVVCAVTGGSNVSGITKFKMGL